MTKHFKQMTPHLIGCRHPLAIDTFISTIVMLGANGRPARRALHRWVRIECQGCQARAIIREDYLLRGLPRGTVKKAKGKK